MSLGDLIADVEATSNAMDRRDAKAWLVVCVDLECVQLNESDCVVACYGPFESPEEALVAAGKLQSTSLKVPAGDPGWAHLVKPMFDA